jgi:hypothetical protein
MAFTKPVDQVKVGRPSAYDVVEVDIPHLGASVPNISCGPSVHSTNMPYQVPHSPVWTRRDRSIEFCSRRCGSYAPTFTLKRVNVFSDLHMNLLYPIRLRQRTYAELLVLNWSSGFVIKKLILPSTDLWMFSTDMVTSPFI